MTNPFSLEGKNAWITGASYGIGFNIAKAFVAAGIKTIIFNDINEEFLARGLANYKEAGIENVKGYVCDVTKEDDVKAVCVSDNGPVWEDSCVEFFVKTPDSPYYFNFETNCIGTGLAAKRSSRKDCTHFTAAMMERILRKSSLPAVPVNDGKGEWTLELTVPFSVLDCGNRPGRLLANFYKCGDKTAQPHFLSWAPIDTPSPDFHRPEFFGELLLEW